MTKQIDRLAEKLGATRVGEVPAYAPGAFGMSALARTLEERLVPGQGRRPGRPSNPAWTKRSKVPMAPATEERLVELARLLSSDARKVSPMQVAAQLLEEAAARYSRRSQEGRSRRRVG